MNPKEVYCLIRLAEPLCRYTDNGAREQTEEIMEYHIQNRPPYISALYITLYKGVDARVILHVWRSSEAYQAANEQAIIEYSMKLSILQSPARIQRVPATPMSFDNLIHLLYQEVLKDVDNEASLQSRVPA